VLSRNILLALASALPIVLALSAAGGAFLANRALKPIATITAQARRIGRDNLNERIALRGPHDEVRELADTVDGMLERLHSAFESEQRFTADASHELRTPLALLKAQIALALAKPRDAETLTQMLGALRGDVDRMTRLVETMLLLARSAEPLQAAAPVHMTPLLNDLIEALNISSAQRNITFVFDAAHAPDVCVSGDPDLLNQLFMNLLDNAAKYSPDGTRVTVKTTRDAGGYVFDVIDHGIGIAPEHLPHVFERFYRIDSSRARETGGAGLGLAIAQALAKRHGGRISVSSAAGSTFSVWLPRAERIDH
jgi:signal transduction histidine kinase